MYIFNPLDNMFCPICNMNILNRDYTHARTSRHLRGLINYFKELKKNKK
jgi:hypothetical protein